MNKKLEYNSRYNKEKYTSVSVRFNTQSEADILEHLAKQGSVKPYIADLIRKDMKRVARNAADRQRYRKKKESRNAADRQRYRKKKESRNEDKEKTSYEVVLDLPYEGHDIITETDTADEAYHMAACAISTDNQLTVVERAYDPDLKCWRGIKV